MLRVLRCVHAAPLARPMLSRTAPERTLLQLRRALSADGSGSASSEKPDDAKPEAGAADAKAEAAAADATGEAAAADGEAASELSETEVLQARVEELEAEVASKHDQVLRALAEADNARRRAGIDVENAHKFAVGKFAKGLLDIADTLSRAAEAVPEEARASDEQPTLKALYEGVTMTDKMLHKTFEEHGLKRLWPDGDKFDPNLHNALFEMPDPSKEAGTVGHVASAGYVLHDRVIRPAGVGVVKAP